MVSVLSIVARWLNVPQLVGERVFEFACLKCGSGEGA
jgi:hypothetical protein